MRELITRVRNLLYWKRCGHTWKHAWYLSNRTI